MVYIYGFGQSYKCLIIASLLAELFTSSGANDGKTNVPLLWVLPFSITLFAWQILAG
jgi:hypothetical protein